MPSLSRIWRFARATKLPRLAEALSAVEQADLLVVGSPVYKGSYTGLFKHFLDLIDYKSLAGVPVALRDGRIRSARSGDRSPASPALRILQCTYPADGVFLSSSAFVDGRIEDAALQNRLSTLVQEASHALKGESPRAVSEAA